MLHYSVDARYKGHGWCPSCEGMRKLARGSFRGVWFHTLLHICTLGLWLPFFLIMYHSSTKMRNWLCDTCGTRSTHELYKRKITKLKKGYSNE